MKLCSVISTLFCSGFLSGCVTPVALEKQVPTAEYVPNGTVAIAVVDQRTRVLLDGKPPTFIGKAHGAFGIPADWHVKPVLSTEEGDKERTLAEFIQHRLMTGLGRGGWSVVSTDLGGDQGTLSPSAALQASGAGHLLMLVLKEWYFSLNLNWVTAFNFDTEVDVIVTSSHSGDTLRKTIKDRDVIDEEAKQSPQNLILEAYRAQLLQILKDKDVRGALTNEGLVSASSSDRQEALDSTPNNLSSAEPAHPLYIYKLRAVGTLRDDGIISEDEFQKRKTKILASTHRAQPPLQQTSTSYRKVQSKSAETKSQINSKETTIPASTQRTQTPVQPKPRIREVDTHEIRYIVGDPSGRNHNSSTSGGVRKQQSQNVVNQSADNGTSKQLNVNQNDSNDAIKTEWVREVGGKKYYCVRTVDQIVCQ